MRIGPFGAAELVVILIVVLVVLAPLLLLWRIFSKTRLPGVLSLLLLLPGFGLVVALSILAFSSWPNIARSR